MFLDCMLVVIAKVLERSDLRRVLKLRHMLSKKFLSPHRFSAIGASVKVKSPHRLSAIGGTDNV